MPKGRRSDPAAFFVAAMFFFCLSASRQIAVS